MTDGTGSLILALANVSPVQVAAVAGLTLLGGFLIAILRQRAAKPPAPPVPKD